MEDHGNSFKVSTCTVHKVAPPPSSLPPVLPPSLSPALSPLGPGSARLPLSCSSPSLPPSFSFQFACISSPSPSLFYHFGPLPWSSQSSLPPSLPPSLPLSLPPSLPPSRSRGHCSWRTPCAAIWSLRQEKREGPRRLR
jgi:hypothetical protein